MLALSLQQPYAWLILQRAYEADPHMPLKPIENRDWPFPGNLKLPERIFIHASLTMYDVSIHQIRDKLTASQWKRYWEHSPQCTPTIR